jgi:hypothetical protein
MSWDFVICFPVSCSNRSSLTKMWMMRNGRDSLRSSSLLYSRNSILFNIVYFAVFRHPWRAWSTYSSAEPYVAWRKCCAGQLHAEPFRDVIYFVFISGSFCAYILWLLMRQVNQHGEYLNSKMRSRKFTRHLLPLTQPRARICSARSLRSRCTFIGRPSFGR